MLFFIRSIFIQILLNAYLVYRIWTSRTIPKFLKISLSLVYTAETILYFIGLFGGENLSVETYTQIQKISGTWVIGQIYLTLLILIFDFINYCGKRWLRFDKLREQHLRTIKTICFSLFSIFIAIELNDGYKNFLHPVVQTVPFSFNKTNNSKQPLAEYKILVASDIHLGYIIDRKILKGYVDLMNAQQADIIIINGDLIDYSLRPLVAEKMDAELRKIKAPKGVFFIPGNHEYKFNSELKLDWIRHTGMTILKDSIANIDNQLYLIGRDDKSNEKRMAIENLMKKADTSKPCIFLAHQPRDIKDGCQYHIPLTICGHTHGGQAFPMNWAGHLLYTSVYGMKQNGDCFSYVTSGLGLSGFPLRIGTHSEIVVFNIEIY